jgi:hypothetical protein
MDEELLPPSILAKGSLRGNEYAWQFGDVKDVVAAARAAGLATLGGQAQFRLPDGICEMYWLDADASYRRPGEPWSAFVGRSADEVLAAFREKVVPADFLAEAQRWPFLCTKIEEGLNVLDYLCFVLSFQTERSALPQRRQGV